MLDIQQLSTVTRRKFLSELELIPIDVLKGFHIHYRDRVPDISNEIPWIHVFNLIAEIEEEVLNNPEIHYKNRVGDTIRFCERMLG